eukprot:gene2503-3194_t
MRKEALLLLVGLAYIAIALGQKCFCADYGRCKFIEGKEGVCSCRIVAEFGEISTSETDEKCVDQNNPEACTRKLKNCKTQYKSNFIFACDDDVQAYTCTSTAGRDPPLPQPIPTPPSPSPPSPSPPPPSPPGGPPSGPTGTTSPPTSPTTTTRTPSTTTSTTQIPTALAAADSEYPAYLISSTNRCPQNYTWISDEDECEHAVPNAVGGNFETDETASKWPPGCHIKANVEGGEDPVFHFNNWFDHDTGERYSGGFDEGHPVCKKDSNGNSNSSSKTSSNDDDYGDIPDTATAICADLPDDHAAWTFIDTDHANDVNYCYRNSVFNNCNTSRNESFVSKCNGTCSAKFGDVFDYGCIPQVKENLPPTRTLTTTTSTSMTTATTSASTSSTSSTSSPSSTPSIPDATPARSVEAVGSNGTANGRFGAVPPGTGNGGDPFGPPSGGNGEAGDGGGSSSDGVKSSGKTVAGIIIAFAVLAVTGGVAYARFGVGRREIARAGNDMVITDTDNPAFATGMRDQESRAAHAAAEAAAGGGWQGGAMQGRLPTVPLITNVLYKSADEQEGPRRAASLPDPSLEYATANHVLSSMGTGFPPHMTHDYEEVQELEQVDYAVVVENDDVGVPSSSPSAGAAAAGGYEVTSFALAQMKSASNRAAQNNTATSTNNTFYNAGVGVPSMYNANPPPPPAAAAAGTYEYEVANIAPPSQVFAASNLARGAGSSAGAYEYEVANIAPPSQVFAASNLARGASSSAGAYEYEATQLSGIQERNSFHNTGAQHTVDEDEERQTIRDLEFVPSSPGVFGSKRGTSFC